MDLNLISNFSLQSDAALQKEAFTYFERLKNDTSGWKICADSLINSSQNMDESGVFFCLQVIENHVKNRYETDSDENRAALRQFLFSWFASNVFTSNYILNKFAYVVNSVFLNDFPVQKWNTFFSDFLGQCQTQKNCDLFLRILLQINADVADREIPRTQKDMERNTLIKDVMRETCLTDLAQFWFNIISNYRETASSTVCLCLEVIGAYVSWIDITLITNDSIMSNLFNLFTDTTFRCSVTDCFNGILHKGMDSLAKTQLIEQFMNVESIKVKIIEICNTLMCGDDIEDENYMFIVKLSKLMNTIGIELIESYKKLKVKSANNGNSDDDAYAITFVSSAIESKFVVLCQFLSVKNNTVSLQIHPFTREYIQWNKNYLSAKTGNKCANLDEKLLIFLRIIIEKCKYPDDYGFSAEEETNFDEFRKSCKVLFDNLMLVNSSIVINFICSHLIEPILMNWRSSNHTYSDIEIVLYYFYLIGENLNLINDQKRIESLLQLMITSTISMFPHHLTQSIYFDLVLRYEKYFSNNLNYLVPQILISFLDDRGFKNRNHKMRSKVSHLFNKFVKSQIKSKGNDKQQNFTDDILKRLQDFLKLDITTNNFEENDNDANKIPNIFEDVRYLIKHEDQLYIYETAALLIISNNNFDINKKQFLLKNLIEPVLRKFDECYAKLVISTTVNGANNTDGVIKVNGTANEHDNAKKEQCEQMSHLITLVARTSKGFSNVQTIKSIGVQSIYFESFNLFVKAVTLSLDEELLYMIQSATRQFLHRLIVCLDESDIVPLLPGAIQSLFLLNQQLNGKTIQELVPLINQVVTKFKHSWLFQRDLMPFLKQIFGPLVILFYRIISQYSDSQRDSQQSLALNDEMLMLQKSYYTFLSVLVINNIFDVFMEIDISMISHILLTVYEGAVNFPDSGTQKICIQILRKFVELFASTHAATNGSTVKPMDQTNNLEVFIGSSFVEFLYTSIVPACFLSPLKQYDDIQLMNECILCLKAIVQSRGPEEFTAYLQTRLFPNHFPNYSNTSELIQALINGDMKITKNAFKHFCQQYKHNEIT